MARASVNSDMGGTDKRWLQIVRAACVTILVVISALTLGGYVAVRWAERQILTTDNWVALVSPLPKQPVVSTALGSFISSRIFDTEAVQSKVTDALPPKAAFLAGPLTGQLHSLATRASQKLVASDGFQAIWTSANRAAMNRLVSTARGQTPPLQAKVHEKFNVDLSASSGQLKNALGTVSSAIPALQPASQKAIQLSADLQSRPRRIHQYIRSVDTLYAVLPLLFAATFLGALALTRRRRHTALIAMEVIVIVLLLELVMLNWGRQAVLDRVQNPDNLAAVGYIYNQLVGWLRHMLYAGIGIAAVIGIMLTAAGPARWARQFRKMIRTDQVMQSRPMRWWRQARLWIGKYEYYGWLAVVLIVLIGLAFVHSVTSRTVVNAVLLAGGLVAWLHILANPPTQNTNDETVVG